MTVTAWLAWGVLHTALAAQTGFKATIEGTNTRLRYSWTDQDKLAWSAELRVSTAAIAQQDAGMLPFPAADCFAHNRRAMEEAAARASAVVTVVDKGAPCSQSWTVRAPKSTLAAASAAVSQAREKAYAVFLSEHGWIKMGDKVRRYHAAMVTENVPSVLELADALYRPLDDARSFGDRALAFVQSIPYTRIDERLGLRPPLSLLAHNEGDCDSKSVLFLSLMKARFPEVPSAMVYVPQHAYVALDVPHRLADTLLTLPDGRRWPIAEPVGAVLRRVGEAGEHSAEPVEPTVMMVR